MGGSGGSNLDERLLKNIADDTGGLYFRAKDVAGLKQIYAELDKLEPISADEKTFRPQSSLFYYPLLIAILLISLNVMLSTLRALKEPN